MSKEEKKKKLQEWKEGKQCDFEASLPMRRSQFEGLFDYLDRMLAEGCLHDHRFTIAYLRSNGIEEEPVLDCLRKNGGYCDCEVLMNTEDAFR